MSPPYDAALLWAFYTEKGLTSMSANPLNKTLLQVPVGGIRTSKRKK